MKVLIVVPHLRTGGGQQLAIDEAIFLSKQKNFEVTILSIGTEEDNMYLDLQVDILEMILIKIEASLLRPFLKHYLLFVKKILI